MRICTAPAATLSIGGSLTGPTIIAGLAVFGDRLGNDPLVVGVRIVAFALILLGAALIPALVRAGDALDDPTSTPTAPCRELDFDLLSFCPAFAGLAWPVLGRREDVRMERRRLLEREDELAALERLLGDALAGSGRTVCIEAAAGVGKSALLDEVVKIAERHAQVLRARPGEFDHDFPFGVVRQLFDPVLAGRPGADADLLGGPAKAAEAVFAEPSSGGRSVEAAEAAYALCWLTANLAESAPLVMVVDDAHWSDVSSLRFLLALARRIHETPVLLLVATRPEAPEHTEGLLRALGGSSRVTVIALRPLTETAARELVASRLGAISAEVASEYHRVTGGNPFYLTALLDELEAHGRPFGQEDTDQLATLVPATVARAVLARIARLSLDAVALARAVAVLGARAEVRHCAAVAGLDYERAMRVADQLSRAAVLGRGRPLDFVHPIVRSAVYQDLELGGRAVLHRRAAELLAAEGLATEAAAHLVATDPAADKWVVELLRNAAQDAMRRGAPAEAARFLERALEEPPGAVEPEVLRELGNAATRAGDSNGIKYLERAVDALHDPAGRVAAALDVAVMLVVHGEHDAMEVLRRVAPEAERLGGDAATAVEARIRQAKLVSLLEPLASADEIRKRGESVDGNSVVARLLLSLLGVESILACEPKLGLSLAGRALGRDEGYAELLRAGLPLYPLLFALALADRYDVSLARASQALAAAAERGSLTSTGMALPILAYVHLAKGDLRDAEATARQALEMPPEVTGISRQLATAVLLDVLRERGELDSAGALLRSTSFDREVSETPFGVVLLCARARLALARSEPRKALDDASQVALLLDRAGVANPSLAPWRALAATAYAAVDDPLKATALAHDEVALSRASGSARALGLSLRTVALVTRDNLQALEESVSLLSTSGAQLEHAYSLTDYGAALRRHGERTRAREPLRRGLDLATRAGASRLAERARDELVAAGARPRRERLSGREALTAGELRVARLAARGLTNRQIAQELFLSMKTVAMHLTHAYQKLDISAREQLPNDL